MLRSRTGRRWLRQTRPRRASLVVLVSAVALLLGATVAIPPAAHAAAAVLLSEGGAATSSSTENADYYPASAAFDASPDTRWSSERSDAQWIQVDLGSRADISRVALRWEGAYGRDYRVAVSDNGVDGWTTLHEVIGGTGGDEGFSAAGTGRYVRLTGTARGTGYGYSLYDFQVYGTPTVATPDPPPTDPGAPTVSGPLTAPSTVKVTGGNGSWALQVNGAPYTVKGFTWGPSDADADKYMPGLVDMGANTIRTWGTGADTRPLLDSAAAHGIRVINGFWLPPGGGPGSGGCIDYTANTSFKATTKTDILNQVRAYQNHPAVLMWDVGNESILSLQDCFTGDKLEAVRYAYAAYVNDVTKAIHGIDPTHPVTSTDAWTGAWKYLKANAPDLDLLAVNSYGDVCAIRQTWIDGGYDKPYILTEGGAPGDWEVANDVNGVPDEPTDIAKAQALVNSWRCVTDQKGVGLGATFFHYGTEGDFGGVWFNVIPGGNKRLGYYALAQAWGAPAFANTPPRISAMDIPGSTKVTAGSTFDITTSVSDPDGDPIKFTVLLNSKYINGAAGLAATDFTQTGNGTLRVRAPAMVGVWKAYVFAEDGHGNVGVESRSFRVAPPTPAGTNVALGHPAKATSFQTTGANFSPGQASDSDLATRWSSDWNADESIQVDLGTPTTFNHVQLVWEMAYGKAYKIQTSDDEKTWTTVGDVTNGDGNVDDLDVSGRGRYVRMQGVERGSTFGYSLYELGVYQS